MHETLAIQHFALLLFKNYLTIQVGMLQRIHCQYNRYESALDGTLIGIKSLGSGYLTHCILDPKTLSRYLKAIADDMEDTTPDYEPVFTNVRSNLTIHCSDTPFVIRPICRSCLLERVYKPIPIPHWCGDLQSLLSRTLDIGCK